MCPCRFTADVFACTTQPERTVRGVRTFTMTPPGGREAATQLKSAEVKKQKKTNKTMSYSIYIIFYIHFSISAVHSITGLLFSHQDVTATDTQIRVILTALSSRQRAASVAVCATTAATIGWALSANAAYLSCTRIHRGVQTTHRPAYVCFYCCFLHRLFL